MAETQEVARRVLRESVAAAWQTAWKLRAVVTIGPLVLAFVVGWFGSIETAVIVFFLAFLAIVFFLAAFRLAAKVRAEEGEPRTYLTFKGADTKPAITVVFANPALGVGGATASTATGPYPVGTDSIPNEFARALIAKDPPLDTKSVTAEKVTGKVKFYDENGALALAMQGRWAETRQRAQSVVVAVKTMGRKHQVGGVRVDLRATASGPLRCSTKPPTSPAAPTECPAPRSGGDR